MFRIVVISLVVCGWASSQLALTPHSHGDGKEHSARPHLHLGRHSQSHDGLCSHSHTREHQLPEEGPLLVAVEGDHDADACYLSLSDGTIEKRADRALPAAEDALGTAWLIADGAVEDLRWNFADHPGERFPSAPPRFLTLRTLRI